ncbi:MAG: TolC family protein [Planctomycetia bacterium]|nr:TolC family protein [Planctomycetia bacterium]
MRLGCGTFPGERPKAKGRVHGEPVRPGLSLVIRPQRSDDRTLHRLIPLLLAAGMLAVVPAVAQQDSGQPQRNPIIEFPDLGPIPGSTEPALGPGPGAMAPDMSVPGPGIVGGRRRNGRIPRGAKARAPAVTAARGMLLPQPLPAPVASRAAPIPMTAIDTSIADDAGPADGRTLDDCIVTMMESNLDVRALRHELTQADADVLTAGLRTNPLVYMDSQFIPYGSFNNQKPGGPTQYDLNITYPIDVSQKRQSRMVVARMARSALEAQFQDVVRRQIDNVYRAFTTLQSARLDHLAAAASVRRQEAFLEKLRSTARPDDAEAADTIEHLALVLDRARGSLGDAAEAVADAQEGLALLLNLPPDRAADLEPRGSVRDAFPPPPPIDELIPLAVKCRPDLLAARQGVSRASAEVGLQRANRFDDVYLFYDPITIQDNSPFGAPSATSWAVGLTFALPIYNRNQGNIARAESNVQQTRLELSSLERRIASEVRLAEREYRSSLEALERIEKAMLPRAEAALRRRTDQFLGGAITADDYQGHLEDAAELAQNHREALIRHRRSMLDLNTAVGLRLLP